MPKTTPNPDSSSAPLGAILEAVLFTAVEPLTATKLAQITNSDSASVKAALATLRRRLESGGLRLAEASGTYRLVTAPSAAAIVQSFLDDTSRQELSRPALETLAIIAYKGPLTKAQVEVIRGVSSETMLRNLTNRGLIAEAGRSQEPGRPPLYTVSHTFLQHFGLTSTTDLPPLPDAEDDPQIPSPEAVHEN